MWNEFWFYLGRLGYILFLIACVLGLGFYIQCKERKMEQEAE